MGQGWRAWNFQPPTSLPLMVFVSPCMGTTTPWAVASVANGRPMATWSILGTWRRCLGRFARGRAWVEPVVEMSCFFLGDLAEDTEICNAFKMGEGEDDGQMLQDAFACIWHCIHIYIYMIICIYIYICVYLFTVVYNSANSCALHATKWVIWMMLHVTMKWVAKRHYFSK